VRASVHILLALIALLAPLGTNAGLAADKDCDLDVTVRRVSAKERREFLVAHGFDPDRPTRADGKYLLNLRIGTAQTTRLMNEGDSATLRGSHAVTGRSYEGRALLTQSNGVVTAVARLTVSENGTNILTCAKTVSVPNDEETLETSTSSASAAKHASTRPDFAMGDFASPPQTVTPKPSVRRPPAPPSEEPPAPVAELQAEFERMKGSEKGVTSEFLDKIRQYIASQEASHGQYMDAQQLLVSAYEERGEKNEALAEFKKYLDLVERRDGREKAAIQANKKAARLFYGKSDYDAAMTYYRLVATRYPDMQKLADIAGFMEGEYYHRQDKWHGAAEGFKRVIETLPADSDLRAVAQLRLAQSLTNEQKCDESIATLENMFATAKDDEAKGSARFCIAENYYVMGTPHYPDAIRELHRLLRDYPHHRFASAAKAMLSKIQRRLSEAGEGGAVTNIEGSSKVVSPTGSGDPQGPAPTNGVPTGTIRKADGTEADGEIR
jgi:TolA-binding protein